MKHPAAGEGRVKFNAPPTLNRNGCVIVVTESFWKIKPLYAVGCSVVRQPDVDDRRRLRYSRSAGEAMLTGRVAIERKSFIFSFLYRV